MSRAPSGPRPMSGTATACASRRAGELLDTVEADRGCFACTLGGSDGRTLYLVTAQWPTNFTTRTGQVLAVRVPVPAAR